MIETRQSPNIQPAECQVFLQVGFPGGYLLPGDRRARRQVMGDTREIRFVILALSTAVGLAVAPPSAQQKKANIVVIASPEACPSPVSVTRFTAFFAACLGTAI